MKMDFLTDTNPDYPDDCIIRLSDFSPGQAKSFMTLINDELVKNKKELDLAKIDFIELVNCTLVMKVSETDIGIERAEDDYHFICELTVDSYKMMANRILIFTEGEKNGYNWLHEAGSDVELLFSSGGGW